MKKRIYLLLCFLPLLQVSYAQFVINQSYDLSGGPDNAFNLIADTDGFYIDAGRLCEGTSDFCSVLFRANTDGDSLWQVVYDYEPEIAIFDYAHDTVNDYLYACGAYFGFGTDRIPFIMKLRENGDTVWLKTYTATYWDTAQDIKLTPGGDLVIGIQGGSFNQFANWTVLKADTSGTLIWQTTIEDDVDYTYGGQLATLENGDIMLTYYYDLDGFDRAYAVSKLDAQGNTQWIKNYDIGTNYFGTLISPHPDGGVVTCWSKDTFSLEYQVSGSNFFVRRLDEEGQSIWKYIQFHDSRRETYGMTVANNGDIVLCGLTRSSELGGEYYSWLARISSEGELLWERFYSYPATTFSANPFKDVTETPDGGLAMCGLIRDTIPGQPQALNDNVWLVKVGADGCLTPNCQDSIIYLTHTREVDNAPAQIKEVFFRAFPNPASGPLQVQFYNPVRYRSARLRVFNMQGQLLWQAPLQKGTQELEVPAGQWASGLYLLQYEADGRVLQVERVVRE